MGSNPTGGHWCLSVVSVVCCQVEVSATDRSFVQRSPTECGASLCVIKKPRTRGGYSPARGLQNTNPQWVVAPVEKKTRYVSVVKFTPDEETSGKYWPGNRVGFISGLDVLEMKYFFPLSGIEPWIIQPVPYHTIAWTIPAPRCVILTLPTVFLMHVNFGFINPDVIRTIRGFILEIAGRESSVGISTRYRLDGPGIESRWRRDFPRLSRPALRVTQPPIQWVQGLSRR